MLDPKFSRARQKRLLDAMAERKLDAVVVGDPQHVYYFSTFRPHWLHFGAFVLFSDGRAWLSSANKPASGAAVEDAVAHEANWMSTLRQEQPRVIAEQVVELLKSRRAKSFAVDASAVTSQVALLAETKP